MYDIDDGGNISYVRNICNAQERNYIMALKKVIQVKCSPLLWPMLGWEGHDKHPCELLPPRGKGPELVQITSLIPAQWSLKGQPLKFQLVSGEEE
jgi:hypothetical protein